MGISFLLTSATYILKFLAALIALGGATIGASAGLKQIKIRSMRIKLLDDESAKVFVGQYNKHELDSALSGYVTPHCSPVDPANRDGEEFLADTRENAFHYFDRVIENKDKAFHLLLADTGMGKTSLCLNYFIHLKKRFREHDVCLVSLSGENSIARIRSVPRKSNTILLLDALDEDSRAIDAGRGRLDDILKSAADFKFVLITCRSQFFLADDSIPYETPLPVLVPRRLGQSSTFTLIRSYISPFGKHEISKYISKHFPLWKPWKLLDRKRATKLAREIPDLAHRPMLLERLPELVKDGDQSTELYDLYDLMVEGWISRESRWISPDDLRNVSFELALYISERMPQNSGRISPDQIAFVAEARLGNNPTWRHLTSRSLLNRDSQGRFKFAHKSILEFLLVKLAVSEDARAWGVPWTPFMKEVFVSWGHTPKGSKQPAIAKHILSSQEGRRNIVPLIDLWAAPAIIGLPNFKRSTERHFTHSGTRLAPSAWRDSSIEVGLLENHSLRIIDREFNLNWELIVSENLDGVGTQLKAIDILKIENKSLLRRFPSYDQFVTLIEGLHVAGHALIADHERFFIADKPSTKEYLVVCLGINIPPRASLRLVDKERKIRNTNRRISTYLTGVTVSPGYAHSLRTRQLWLRDDILG